RLRHPGELGIGGARPAVLVRTRFGPAENRSEARVRALEHAAPLVARLALERLHEAAAHLRPARALVLRRQVAETQARAKLGKKLVFDGADRHVFAVRGLVDVVPRRAAVEDVFAARFGP